MKLVTAPSVPTVFNTLRDVSRGLVFMPSSCPRGIAAAGHWRPADVLPFDGTNAVCACHPDTAVVA